MTRSCFLAGLLILLLCTFSYAATIHVPSEQPTIQAGIDAAFDGDTVLVASGSYSENLVVNNKGITLLSESGFGSTTILPASTGMHTLEYVNNFDKINTVQGFKFTGVVGFSCIWSSQGYLFVLTNQFIDNDVGYAAVTILGNCTVRENEFVSNINADHGGGLGVDIRDSALVEKNVFRDNSATYGGGIDLLSSVGITVRYNLFVGNSSTAYGGAIYLGDSHDSQVYNNTIDNCVSEDGLGGGIAYWVSSNVASFNNIIVNCDGYAIWQGSSSSCWEDYNDCYGNSPSDYFDISPGAGSISTDPLFEGGIPFSYNLQPVSPCIDAGDPDPEYNDPDGSRNDMGAFPFEGHLPRAYGINLGSEDLQHILTHVPTIYWSYFDPSSQPQVYYEVEIGTDNDWDVAEMWATGEVSSPDTFVTYTGAPLLDGEAYYSRVRVSNGTEWGDWDEFFFRMNSIPSTPSLVSPDDEGVITSDPLVVSVSSSDAEMDVLEFTTEIALSSSFEFPLIITEQGSSGETVNVIIYEILEENHRYWWRAKVTDSYEESDYSAAQTFYVNQVNESPMPFSLVEPGGVEGGAIDTLTPTFIWNLSDEVDPFDTVSYTLVVALDSNFAFAIHVPDIPDTSHTHDFQLEWYTDYWWKVEAVDLHGGATWSSEVFRFHTREWICGDVNHNGVIRIDDIIRVINYVFFPGSPPPYPLESGDVDCTGAIDMSDVVYLISYIFVPGSPAPCDPDGDGEPDC